MCQQSTPGENLGSGHFYLAENRTFLLCVDIQYGAIWRKYSAKISRPRSSIPSVRKCRSQLHSAFRGLAPSARVPQKIAADIRRAPSSPPKPCPQQYMHSKQITALAPPDGPCSMQREPFRSRVQLVRQQSESPPPASPSVP